MAELNLRTPNGYDGQPGTQTKMGIVRLATDAEATAGTSNRVALTPSNGVLAVPNASETVRGIVFLATNAEAVTGTNSTDAIVPSSLTARLAAPGPIGATTRSTGDFTTLQTATTIVAGTTLTATLGNITATNGNVVLSTAGNKLVIATGANASAGASTAMVAGEIFIATTACSASALIFYCRDITGGAPGHVSITTQDGTGFTLTSTSATEVSSFNWWIINA